MTWFRLLFHRSYLSNMLQRWQNNPKQLTGSNRMAIVVFVLWIFFNESAARRLTGRINIYLSNYIFKCVWRTVSIPLSFKMGRLRKLWLELVSLLTVVKMVHITIEAILFIFESAPLFLIRYFIFYREESLIYVTRWFGFN